MAIGLYAPLDGLEFAEGISEDSIKVIGVEIINSNTARVYFSEEPRHFNTLAERDSFLRDNWSISIVGGPGSTPVVERVENAQPRPTTFAGVPLAWSIDIRIDSRFLYATEYLFVASSTIVSADGSTPMAISPDDRASAFGIIEPRSPKLNPTRPASLGIDLRYDIFEGRYILDGKNDIDVQAGLEALKKRIIRRLITAPGEFYYLPDYGLGLQSKKLLRTTSLARLEADMKAQVLAEPEVDDATVRVSRLATGIYLFVVTARTKQGVVPEIQLKVDDGGHVFVA